MIEIKFLSFKRTFVKIGLFFYSDLQTVPTDSPGSSTTTIELKESEGKTEIKKE